MEKEEIGNMVVIGIIILIIFISGFSLRAFSEPTLFCKAPVIPECPGSPPCICDCPEYNCSEPSLSYCKDKIQEVEKFLEGLE